MQLEMIFGMPPVMAAGRELLPLFLQMYETPQYKADAAIIYGTQIENHALYPDQAALAAEWNSTYAYPHLRYSGFHEAMEAIARRFGNSIPTVRGDGGPYWEDGVASDAVYVALERRNEARAPSAEKLATLASLTDPQLAVKSAAFHGIWKNMMLMDEHTWGSADSVSDPEGYEAADQLAIKDSYALDAAAGIEFLARRSMAELADRIAAGPNSLIVFNTLNWKRNGMVSLDLGKGEEIEAAEGSKAVPWKFWTGARMRIAYASWPRIFRPSAIAFTRSGRRRDRRRRGWLSTLRRPLRCRTPTTGLNSTCKLVPCAASMTSNCTASW